MPRGYGRIGQFRPFFAWGTWLFSILYTYMTTKETKTNNLTIVRNVAYSQIKKMKKNIKEIVEVDKDLLDIIDINMKNAINKIIHDYNFKKINQ